MFLPLVGPIFRNVMRVVSTVVYLLTILSAFGGKFNPQYFTIPAVFTLALPYFAIATGGLVIFWACMRKLIFTGLGVGTIILCMAPMAQAFPFGSKKSPTEGKLKFSLMSYNILHTDDRQDPQYPGNRAVEFILHSGMDIVCLAELHNFTPEEFKKASPQLVDSLIRAYPYRAGLSSTDIKVMSKYPVERTGYKWDGERYGWSQRFDLFKVRFPGGHTLNLAMVHLYSYDLSEDERKVVTGMRSAKGLKNSAKEFKSTIYSKLRNAFQRRAENAELLRKEIDKIKGPLIVCGDFNDVPASWSYNLIVGDDLKDAYTETNFGPTFTYNAHMFYFHIDQILYKGDLKALSVRKGKIKTSDHYPLLSEFEFTK